MYKVITYLGVGGMFFWRLGGISNIENPPLVFLGPLFMGRGDI
jgi:hypothetical protein